MDPADLATVNIEAHLREVGSGEVMARAGYDVEYLPQRRGNELNPQPDYRIEGRVFDCKAPTTPRARNIASYMERKIEQGQASRFVINLDGSSVTPEALRHQLTTWPTPGLEEVIVVKGDQVLPLFP
jgi:hypothetical protein